MAGIHIAESENSHVFSSISSKPSYVDDGPGTIFEVDAWTSLYCFFNSKEVKDRKLPQKGYLKTSSLKLALDQLRLQDYAHS